MKVLLIYDDKIKGYKFEAKVWPNLHAHIRLAFSGPLIQLVILMDLLKVSMLWYGFDKHFL